MIKKHPAFLLYAYAMGTVFTACSTIKSSVGNGNPGIKRKDFGIPYDIAGDLVTSLSPHSLAQMRKVNQRWRSIASPALTRRKKATIYIPSIQQLPMLENMLKRIKTLRLRDLIIEINPGLPPETVPSIADFLPLSENEALQKGNTSLAGLQSLRLNLAHLGIQPVDMHFLTGMPLLQTTILDLTHNEIGAEGMEMLAQADACQNLKELILNGSFIQDAGATALSQMNMPNITTLNLRDNAIGDQGATALSQMNLSNITMLDLTNNNVGVAGVLALCNQLNLSNNQDEVHVFVCNNGLNNEDIQELLGNAGLQNINDVNDVHDQNIGEFVINNIHVYI